MTIIDRRYSVAEGTAVKAPCRVATTLNITLSGEQTIDGIAAVQDDRVLVMNQADQTLNGIYTCSTGNWTRTRDFDGAYDIVSGTRVFVNHGTANGTTEFFVSTSDPIVIGTTLIVFTSIPSVLAAVATAIGLGWSTGDVKITLKNVADSGWRLFDDGTIGDASSGATFANIAAFALFTLMFNNFLDANCAILTSAGSGTTRAAQTDAATAWAAHCRISLPKTLGRALAIAGAGSGLTTRALGQTVGGETETLGTANLPAYTPAGTLNLAGTVVGSQANFTVSAGGTGLIQAVGTEPVTFTTETFTGTAQGGTDTAFSILDPTTYLNAMVKL